MATGPACAVVNFRSSLCLLLVLAIYQGVLSDLTTKPLDSESIVNDSTYFNCSSSITAKEIEWFHYPVGVEAYERKSVYAFEKFYKDYEYDFILEKNVSNGAYSLVIKTVKTIYAGQYECQEDGGQRERASAQLIVLHDEPQCNSNINPYGGVDSKTCLNRDEVLLLSCSISYQGNIPPELKWIKLGDNVSISENVTLYKSASRVTSNLTIKADLLQDKSSFHCQTATSGTSKHSCTPWRVTICSNASSSPSTAVVVGVALGVLLFVVVIVVTVVSLLRRRNKKRKDGEERVPLQDRFAELFNGFGYVETGEIHVCILSQVNPSVCKILSPVDVALLFADPKLPEEQLNFIIEWTQKLNSQINNSEDHFSSNVERLEELLKHIGIIREGLQISLKMATEENKGERAKLSKKLKLLFSDSGLTASLTAVINELTGQVSLLEKVYDTTNGQWSKVKTFLDRVLPLIVGGLIATAVQETYSKGFEKAKKSLELYRGQMDEIERKIQDMYNRCERDEMKRQIQNMDKRCQINEMERAIQADRLKKEREHVVVQKNRSNCIIS